MYVSLSCEDRDVGGLGREGALGKAADGERHAGQRALWRPLADEDVLERAEVVDGAAVDAVVDVDDARVVGGRREVARDVVGQAGEHGFEQRRIPEGAERAVVLGLQDAIGARDVAHHAEQHEVVVAEPLEQAARAVGDLRRRRHAPRARAPAACHRGLHRREVGRPPGTRS